MKLSEHKIYEFVDVLASNSPAPGGGSAAALAGSIGIALTQMVGQLTIGKEKYKEFEQDVAQIISKSEELCKKLVKAIDDDTEAYNKVTAVFKMPKSTDEEKEARKTAMQNALKFATQAPLTIMELSFEAIKVTENALGKTNTNALSDLGVAALTLKACIQGGWLNVLTNLGSIKDEAFINEYKTKANEMLDEALPLCDKIYDQVVKAL